VDLLLRLSSEKAGTSANQLASGDYFELDVSEVQYPNYDHIGLQQYPAKDRSVALTHVKHTGRGWGAKFGFVCQGD
jgi:hypothetical protein